MATNKSPRSGGPVVASKVPVASPRGGATNGFQPIPPHTSSDSKQFQDGDSLGLIRPAKPGGLARISAATAESPSSHPAAGSPMRRGSLTTSSLTLYSQADFSAFANGPAEPSALANDSRPRPYDTASDLDRSPPGPSPLFKAYAYTSASASADSPPAVRAINSAPADPQSPSASAGRVDARSRLLAEIIDSERSYVRGLDTMLDIFYKPLTTLGVVSQPELQSMFSNFRDIRELNFRLLTELEDRRKHFAHDLANLCLHDIFDKYIEELKIYAQYLNNHAHAVNTLDSLLQSNTIFAQFLDGAMQTPRCGGKHLNAFLITPVQRVPRYRLLFAELLKLTPEAHRDREHIAQTLKRLEQLATFLNDKARASATHSKMLELQDTVEGLENVTDFVKKSYSRLYIQESLLQLDGGKKAKLQRVVLFLFSDMLLYALVKGTGQNMLFGALIHLNEHTRVVDVADTEERQLVFGVKHRTSNTAEYSETYFVCADAVEKKKWVHSIKQIINEVLRASYNKDKRGTKELSAGGNGSGSSSGSSGGGSTTSAPTATKSPTLSPRAVSPRPGQNGVKAQTLPQPTQPTYASGSGPFQLSGGFTPHSPHFQPIPAPPGESPPQNVILIRPPQHQEATMSDACSTGSSSPDEDRRTTDHSQAAGTSSSGLVMRNSPSRQNPALARQYSGLKIVPRRQQSPAASTSSPALFSSPVRPGQSQDGISADSPSIGTPPPVAVPALLAGSDVTALLPPPPPVGVSATRPLKPPAVAKTRVGGLGTPVLAGALPPPPASTSPLPVRSLSAMPLSTSGGNSPVVGATPPAAGPVVPFRLPPPPAVGRVLPLLAGMKLPPPPTLPASAGKLPPPPPPPPPTQL